MKDWFIRAFSDNGEPSSSRLLTAIVVAFACGWVTAIVKHTHQLPEFGGISLFIGSLYGLNRLTTAFGSKQDTPQQH